MSIYITYRRADRVSTLRFLREKRRRHVVMPPYALVVERFP